MTIDIQSLRSRWASKFGLGDDAKIGVAASFGENIRIGDSGQGYKDITVIVNTEELDLDDEVVLPSGGDMRYLDANKKVFADHQYDLEHTVGTLRDLKPYPSAKDHRAWKAIVRMDTSPLAMTILRFARAGSIGASIGFVADDVSGPNEEEAKRFTKGGRRPDSIVRKWRALEFSFTAMPCNVGCQSLAVHECDDEVKRAAIEGLVTKGLIDKRLAADIGFRERKPARRVVVLEDGSVVTMASR